MKSVVRLQSEGKAKDVGLRGLRTVPAAECCVELFKGTEPHSAEKLSLVSRVSLLRGPGGLAAAVVWSGSASGTRGYQVFLKGPEDGRCRDEDLVWYRLRR